MKKLLAVLMILATFLSFAACSSKTDDADVPSSTTIAEGESNTSAAADETTTEAEKTTGDDKTTNAATSAPTTKKAKTTTTEAQTTKRRIKLTVVYPSAIVGQKVTITYKQKNENDKKYRELVKDELIDSDQKSYELKDELIGDVDVHITVTGPTPLLRNYFVVSGRTADSRIELITSSEQLEGGFD